MLRGSDVSTMDSTLAPHPNHKLCITTLLHAQFQAAWALTNVASGATEHTSVIVEHGAVPAFVKLLESPDENVGDTQTNTTQPGTGRFIAAHSA